MYMFVCTVQHTPSEAGGPVSFPDQCREEGGTLPGHHQLLRQGKGKVLSGNDVVGKGSLVVDIVLF